jgi:hypothetical protein
MPKADGKPLQGAKQDISSVFSLPGRTQSLVEKYFHGNKKKLKEEISDNRSNH